MPVTFARVVVDRERERRVRRAARGVAAQSGAAGDLRAGAVGGGVFHAAGSLPVQALTRMVVGLVPVSWPRSVKPVRKLTDGTVTGLPIVTSAPLTTREALRYVAPSGAKRASRR